MWCLGLVWLQKKPVSSAWRLVPSPFYTPTHPPNTNRIKGMKSKSCPSNFNIKRRSISVLLYTFRWKFLHVWITRLSHGLKQVLPPALELLQNIFSRGTKYELWSLEWHESNNFSVFLLLASLSVCINMQLCNEYIHVWSCFLFLYIVACKSTWTSKDSRLLVMVALHVSAILGNLMNQLLMQL